MIKENTYKVLFESSTDAMLVIEADMFVDCNESVVKMLRYKDKEELLKTHPSVLSPELQPDGRSSFEKANEMMTIAFEKGSNRFEWDHKRAGGEVFPVEVLLTPISIEGKEMLHVAWRDITERKLAEEALLKSKEDLEVKVKELNLFFEISKVLLKQELSLDEILKRILLLIPFAWQYDEIACAALCLDDGRSFLSERFKKSEWTMKREVMAHGTLVGVLEVFYSDKGKYENSESLFLESEEMLIDAVANQLGKIIENKEREMALEDARIQAEAANNAKSEFLANMSHELRTPMNAITGFTNIVLKSDISEINKNALSVVMRSSNSLMQIINDILDISKIEAGKLELNNCDFALKETVEFVLSSFSIAVEEEKLELKCDISPDAPTLLNGDAGRLRQILLNLVGNAVKFTHKGGVYIELSRCRGSQR